MNNTSIAPSAHRLGLRIPGLSAVLAILAGLTLPIAPPAQAAVTDISTQPLVTLTTGAKPNLLFVMDSSGSMNWSYMPDDLGLSYSTQDEPYTGWYGYTSSQCNGVAYDPNATYTPPLKYDGTPYPNMSFGNAYIDGYAGGQAIDLGTGSITVYTGTNFHQTSTRVNTYYKYTGTQPVMGWAYTSAGHVANTFFNECSSTIGNAPGSNVFTLVTMTASSPDATNYANWFSYYSHRYLLMRTAMGRAIATLDSSYRVGFSTIYDSTAKQGSSPTTYFVDVKDFDAAQKQNFYSSLYSVAPGGNTPLPSALAEAGRYYGNKIANQTYDPVQYSCQRNYTLLSTDGYWNVTTGIVKLDGTSPIGEQDGSEVRPMKDASGSTTTTTVTPYSAPVTSTSVSSKSRSVAWTKTTVVSSSLGTVRNGPHTPTNCTASGYYLIHETTQTASESQTVITTITQTSSSNYSETVVNKNGNVLSDTSTTPTTTAPSTVTTTTYTDTTNAHPTSATPTDPAAGAYSTPPTAVTLCQTTLPTSADTNVPGTYSASTTPVVTTSTGAYVAGTPTVNTVTGSGSSNTLADVAEYYYETDLRTTNCTSGSSGQDVCANNVRPVGTDTATWQHMNTFTIGLGASGTLPYDKNYLTQTSGSYVQLRNGTLDWPAPNTSGDATNIDDLWHAAVDGRGQYYSALNATLLAEAINSVVHAVQEVTGAGAAASTSALVLVAGNNNQVYKASYTTGVWTGNVQAYSIDPATAVISTTVNWSAQPLLDGMTVANRNIYFSSGGSTPTMQAFNYSNLNTAGKSAYFNNLCSQSSVAAQCANLNTADKNLANSGTNLVNYLIGDRTYEAVTSSTQSVLYRTRDHRLGDIIDGNPVYIGKPPFAYADAGYADYVTAQTSRKPAVYVASNDGMLHAFSASAASTSAGEACGEPLASRPGGCELWAYVPSMVMPNLYKLANSNYSTAHQYYVDGAPIMGDVKDGGTWKTILVAGLDGGGAGYYALDITDATNPKPLWEFTDANLGLTYGNPIITKRADGTWIVAITSGYNNTSGDGKGHLYILNAMTGALQHDIVTSAGSSTSPSGLSKINAWVESKTDNTSLRFYGGDLMGNLWRFDTDSLVQPHLGALQLAIFQTSSTVQQPITTKPQTVEMPGGAAVVVVGTGRYLGLSDVTNTSQQSIYAVKDPLTNTSWGDVRADTSDFVKQTLTVSGTGATATASVTDLSVDWGVKGGWWVDLPNSGERVATDMALEFDELSVLTAIPSAGACQAGGSSWIYYLDVSNGGAVVNNPVGSSWSTTSIGVGQTWVETSSGGFKVIIQNSDGSTGNGNPPPPPPGTPQGAHRTSWRELAN